MKPISSVLEKRGCVSSTKPNFYCESFKTTPFFQSTQETWKLFFSGCSSASGAWVIATINFKWLDQRTNPKQSMTLETYWLQHVCWCMCGYHKASCRWENVKFVQHGANIHLRTSSMCGLQNAFNTKTPLGSSYNNIFELPVWKLYDIRVSWPSSTHVEAVFQFGTSVQWKEPIDRRPVQMTHQVKEENVGDDILRLTR